MDFNQLEKKRKQHKNKAVSNSGIILGEYKPKLKKNFKLLRRQLNGILDK
jgi:hypothetical protein